MKIINEIINNKEFEAAKTVSLKNIYNFEYVNRENEENRNYIKIAYDY